MSTTTDNPLPPLERWPNGSPLRAASSADNPLIERLFRESRAPELAALPEEARGRFLATQLTCPAFDTPSMPLVPTHTGVSGTADIAHLNSLEARPW